MRPWVVDLRQIRDLDETVSVEEAAHRVTRARAEPLPQDIDDCCPKTSNGLRAELLTIICQQATGCGSAEGMRLLQYRVEDGRQVAGRAVDDLQHLGGCGLPLQRLARLGPG